MGERAYLGAPRVRTFRGNLPAASLLGGRRLTSNGSAILCQISPRPLRNPAILHRLSMAIHRVAQGDCFCSIAEERGFTDHQTLYDAPANRLLREARPNPNILLPGDLVDVPEKERRVEHGSTNQRHVFRVRSKRARLYLRLVLDGEPLEGEEYVLLVDGRSIEGKTRPDGTLDLEIESSARSAVLRVPRLRIERHLSIGGLDPIGTVSGVQGRLMNLGYDCGAIDGVAGPRTRAAIRAFQKDNPPLAADGIAGSDTLDALTTRYGC